MYSHEHKLRVRYAETDQMGFVYYGNYAQYFEVGRVEALRSLGFPYKKIEDSGVNLPVLSFDIKYFKAATYDEEICIKTSITELPSARIHFSYETFSEKGELLNKGNTTLVFVDQKTARPRRCPEDLLEALSPYY